MEDIRLGRKLATTPRFVQLPINTLTTVCGPDPFRTRLILWTDGANQISFGPKGLGITATAGMQVNTTPPYVELTVEMYGKAITGAWEAICAGGPMSLVVIECSLEQQ